ncbi:MAG: hypothetical protein R3F43_02070 [bacterium]
MTERSDAATAGRGFLVITAAKLWFMVGGVSIFGLPYIFGSSLYGDDTDGRALYGQFIDLNNTLSILSMVDDHRGDGVAVRGRAPDAPGAVVRQALRLDGRGGALVGGGFIAAAPWIAEPGSNPGLVNGYRAAGPSSSRTAHTVLIGTLNGQKRFFHQALFDIGFTTEGDAGAGLALAGLGVVSIWRLRPGGRGADHAGGHVARRSGLAQGEPAPRALRLRRPGDAYTLVFNVVFKLDADAQAHRGGSVHAGRLAAWMGRLSSTGCASAPSRRPATASWACTGWPSTSAASPGRPPSPSRSWSSP